MKYIFFDWGHTLISKFKDVDYQIEEILKKYNLCWDNIFKEWKSYQKEISLGQITHDKMYKAFSSDVNISKEDAKKIDMLLLESHILDDETRGVIEQLYNKGYYLGIITNNSIRNIQYILKRENVERYFRKIVISEKLKVRKPNMQMYLKAFEEIQKKEYNNIFFVSDELIEDIEPVNNLGINTVWFEQNIESKWKKKEITEVKPDYTIKTMIELLNIVDKEG